MLKIYAWRNVTHFPSLTYRDVVREELESLERGVTVRARWRAPNNRLRVLQNALRHRVVLLL